MTTTSNRSGGIQGGISNGMPIDLRAVFKPTATVLKPQVSADNAGNNVDLQAKGRHDPRLTAGSRHRRSDGGLGAC